MSKPRQRKPSTDPNVLPDDVHHARNNWLNWQRVYENKDPTKNELLQNPDTSFTFLAAYFLIRTIKSNQSDALRIHLLRSSFLQALQDESGRQLEQQAKLLKRFGSREHKITYLCDFKDCSIFGAHQIHSVGQIRTPRHQGSSSWPASERGDV